MDERALEAIRQLPRPELEAFALRASAWLRDSRKDAENNRIFMAILTGFLLGALVASAAFLLGAGLG